MPAGCATRVWMKSAALSAKKNRRAFFELIRKHKIAAERFRPLHDKARAQLARELTINPNTVARAYRELELTLEKLDPTQQDRIGARRSTSRARRSAMRPQRSPPLRRRCRRE